MSSRILIGALVAFGSGALAPAAAQSPAQPYAGLASRQIKALSAEQTTDLAAGRGMGFALAAELNGYPGPLHALELTDRLGLSDAQHAAITRQFDQMKAEAIQLGQRLIAAEQQLDRAFAERSITPERLQAATASIAAIGGELRQTHLRYHLSTTEILNAEQIRRYAELRGYSGAAATPHSHHGAPPHGATDHPHQHRRH